MNGATFDTEDFELRTFVGDLLVGVFLPLFAEDLEAHIRGVDVNLVVCPLIAQQINRGCPRSGRFRGHLQLFMGWLGP